MPESKRPRSKFRARARPSGSGVRRGAHATHGAARLQRRHARRGVHGAMDAERNAAAASAAAAGDDGAPPAAEADEGADERTVTFVEEADELLRLASGGVDDAAYARIAAIVRPLACARRAFGASALRARMRVPTWAVCRLHATGQRGANVAIGRADASCRSRAAALVFARRVRSAASIRSSRSCWTRTWRASCRR
jgi:hypothetical protein